MEALNTQRLSEENALAPEGAPEEDTETGEGTDEERSRESAEREQASFQELIEGRYRQAYEQAVSQRIQAAIQQRFRNQQDYKAKLDAYQPILDALKERYGRGQEEPEKIAARMQEETAGQKAEEARANMQRAAIRRHFASLAFQAEEMKRQFPDFDLMREMHHPAFLSMTAPGKGISVKDAFYAVHGEELQRDSMRYAARAASQRIAASVRAGASRPVENGLTEPGPVHVGIDIDRMDKATREAYRQRIRNGELINFRDRI